MRSRLANSFSQPAAASAGSTPRPRNSSYEPGVDLADHVHPDRDPSVRIETVTCGVDDDVLEPVLELRGHRLGGLPRHVDRAQAGWR